jgi:hypothetical protein
MFSALLFSCKNKKKGSGTDKTFISVNNIIREEIAHIDTSLYSIIKVESDGTRTDTTPVSREAFRKYASEFLELPDISSKKLRDDYEETSFFDTLTNKAGFSYTTTDPELEIKHQVINILPVPGIESMVETIYVHRIIEENNALVEKKMTWEARKWFQVVTITQKENAPEQVHKLKLIWTEGPSAD